MLRGLVLSAPPNVTEGLNPRSLGELVKAAVLGRDLARLPMSGRRALLDLFTKSAADYLDGWFERARQGALRLRRGRGQLREPLRGTAYVLLHHAFGEVNQQGVWGHAIGGMGAITQAMAKAARAAGVEIETGAPVRGGRRGAGPRHRRRPRRRARPPRPRGRRQRQSLYTRMVPADALPPDFPRACGAGAPARARSA